MEKYLNRFYDIIDKIGKHNFILIIFIFVAILSTGFYQTFSLYTESEGLSILNDIKTYSFILKNNGEENSIVVAANSSKNIDITVTNESESNLKYGLYYSSSLSEDDINIGYLTSTVHQPSGVVPKSTSYVVTIKVDNLTEENVTINFGLKYGFESGGDLGIEEGEYWFLEYEEIVNYPLLSEMPVGSYIAYIGNNGCDTTDVGGWTSCSGKNANYVDDTDMGYCHDSNYKFNQNGWRIAYIEDNGDTDIENDNAVIISAGAPECLNNITGVDSDTATIISKYCNNLYIKNGTCDASVIDNNYIKMIDDTFFSNLTDNTLDTCSINGIALEECGSNNDLISVGGFYWFKTASTWNNYFMQNNFVNSSSNIEVGEEGVSYGIRPVLVLDSSVVVTGGTGLYGDPYIISK